MDVCWCLLHSDETKVGHNLLTRKSWALLNPKNNQMVVHWKIFPSRSCLKFIIKSLVCKTQLFVGSLDSRRVHIIQVGHFCHVDSPLQQHSSMGICIKFIGYNGIKINNLWTKLMIQWKKLIDFKIFQIIHNKQIGIKFHLFCFCHAYLTKTISWYFLCKSPRGAVWLH